MIVPGGRNQGNMVFNYCIEETFEGENIWKFQGFVAIHKDFLRNIWARGIPWQHQRAICKRFLLQKFTAIPVLRCETLYIASHYVSRICGSPQTLVH